MLASRIADRGRIEAFLRTNTALFLYAIGDLDAEFWPYTTWRALTDGPRIRAISLVYSRGDMPTVVLLSDDPEQIARLASAVLDDLPGRFFGHFTEGVERIVASRFTVTPLGLHARMLLRDWNDVRPAHPALIRLGDADLAELQRLYDECGDRTYFAPWMLASGVYFGLREDGRIVSVAGTHIVSRSLRVAALGNIVTLPPYRNRGYCRVVTSAVCAALRATVDDIGLNVRMDNEPAIRCYRHLGFRTAATYLEAICQAA